MTISKTSCRAEYTGNGALLVYPYDYYIGAAAELLVYVAGVLKSLGVDYTVTGAGGSEAGGNVTFLVAPANNALIVILRATPQTQATDLVAGGKFYENSIEEMVDKATRMLQEVQERLGRVPALPVTSSYENLSLPDPAAGQALVWKDDLSGLKNSLFSASGVLTGNISWGSTPPDSAAVGDNHVRINTAFEVGGNMGWVTIGGEAYVWGFVSANPV